MMILITLSGALHPHSSIHTLTPSIPQVGSALCLWLRVWDGGCELHLGAAGERSDPPPGFVALPVTHTGRRAAGMRAWTGLDVCYPLPPLPVVCPPFASPPGVCPLLAYPETLALTPAQAPLIVKAFLAAQDFTLQTKVGGQALALLYMYPSSSGGCLP